MSGPVQKWRAVLDNTAASGISAQLFSADEAHMKTSPARGKKQVAAMGRLAKARKEASTLRWTMSAEGASRHAEV